jgi:hypothetical protein
MKQNLNIQRFSNLQLELLKLFQMNLNNKELIEIKNLLAQYFAKKATDDFDNFVEKNNIAAETINNWKNEHLRTEYKRNSHESCS